VTGKDVTGKDVTGKDWYAWHEAYEDPESGIARRLTAVQRAIVEALDGYPPGRITALSMCAGQGRDLIGALADHPRGADVVARLVELDPRNAAVAVRLAAEAGLPGIEVVVGDAALTDHYADLAPADLVLVCGVFGNISDADVRTAVAACTQLCRAGGTVLWTRHRRPPDLVPRICAWFAGCGFEPVSVSDPAQPFGLGVHRFAGRPQPLATGTRIFGAFRPAGA
jgi:Methyltransferase domain